MTEDGGGSRDSAGGAPLGTAPPPESDPGATARHRIETLLDSGSFAEIDRLATGRNGNGLRGESVVVGTGTIDGRDVAVYAFDPSVLGGSLGEVTAEKLVKLQELALRVRVPLVGLHESSGVRSADGLAALAGCGRVLAGIVRSSGAVPQVSVLCGPCQGEALFLPALADLVVAADGTEAGLGVHLVAADEDGRRGAVRRVLSYLPSHSGEAPPFAPTGDPATRAVDALQAYALDSRQPAADVREVARHLLDDGGFLELQGHAAPNLVVGLGRLGGHPVGVVANQPGVLGGAIDADAAVKAARFVRLCDAFNVPLVSLVDSPGLAAAPPREGERLVRHGAQLLYAFAEATVPRLAVVVGRELGWAALAMSPRAAGADLVVAWPGSRIGTADEDAYAAAERGCVDAIIEPRETRGVLHRALLPCLGRARSALRNHGNIPL